MVVTMSDNNNATTNDIIISSTNIMNGNGILSHDPNTINIWIETHTNINNKKIL